MVLFSDTYANAMDRNYHQTPSSGKVGSGIVKIADLGQSIIDGARAGRFQQSIQAAIRAGASRLELNPKSEHGFGTETYGVEERQELRALAKINNIDLHGVHAPPEVVGDVTGRTNEGFSEQKRFENIEEIKKNIDFAADVLDGGHVVVHLGEYPRSIAKAQWNEGDKQWKGSFHAYEGEGKEATYYLVDPKTGRLIAGVKEDEKIFMPKLISKNGIEQYDVDENGEFIINEITFKQFREDKRKENPKLYADNHEVAKEFIKFQQDADKLNLLGRAKEYESHYRRQKEEYDKVYESLEQRQKGGAPEEELRQLRDALKSYSASMAGYQEIAISSRRQAAQMDEQMGRIETINAYGKRKAMDSMSDLGIYSMRVEKAKKTSRPMYMAPENVFPQMGYGSHPDEMIEFVEGSRKDMVKKLTSPVIEDSITRQMIKNPEYVKGMSEAQARKLAEKHLKATFDTQHLGMWYKHFKPKPRETEEQRLKRFNGWYMDQVKKLEKSGIIGNLHIVDGFGRGHTHVDPGHGVFPVVTAVEYLKKKGYEGHMISEAFEQPHRQLSGAWEAFGSPIYHAVGRPSGPRFSDVQNSYFGRTNPMPFVFGGYAPSEEWTLWSGVPLE